MSRMARVHDIEALRAFKAALQSFAETANTALAHAEAELHRTLHWLENEQQSYWKLQLRKRTEAVSRAQEAVRMKRMFPDATGKVSSAVDELKALAKAKAALAEAEQKMINIRRHRNRLRREMQTYKGAVQPFANQVQLGIPHASAQLDNLAGRLEAYISLEAPEAPQPVPAPSDGSGAAAAEALPSMARGEGVEMPQPDAREGTNERAPMTNEAPVAETIDDQDMEKPHESV